MKEIVKQDVNLERKRIRKKKCINEESERKKDEKVFNNGKIEELIERIKEEKNLDPDTRSSAIKAVEFFHVDYEDAIKIAEVVNMLWKGEKHNVRRKIPSNTVFINKIFPIAKQFKDVRTINDVPKDVISDVQDFKNSYNERVKMHEFRQDKKFSRLLNYVSSKIKKVDDLEKSDDREWIEVLNKLDAMGHNLEDIERKTEKFIEVWITQVLIDYYEKLENIKERKKNGFGIRGFEDCDQLSNEGVKKFLFETFRKKLLNKALIAELKYSPKFVILNKKETRYIKCDYLDEKEFLELKNRIGDG